MGQGDERRGGGIPDQGKWEHYCLVFGLGRESESTPAIDCFPLDSISCVEKVESSANAEGSSFVCVWGKGGWYPPCFNNKRYLLCVYAAEESRVWEFVCG